MEASARSQNEPDDHRLAARVAGDAGRLLVDLRDEFGATTSGPPTSDPGARRTLGAEGDRRAHRLIVDALAAARPHDAVRSEEDEHPSDVLAGRLWIVDPLDGTREYSEGRADFAVHVALAIDGSLAAGAVALPGENLVLATGDGAGAPPRLAPRADGPRRVVVSRTRPPAVADVVARRLGAELVPLGSAGAKAMAVVRGEADAYVHAGGQYEWDSAAPVAVALAAGAYAARLDGSPLVYGRADPFVPDLVVCRPELTDMVREALRSL
ncbi:MAG TPA: 3'(2'),5'-bisphosphate nucleotidase CysQ [Acidimicrobiales bacterium]|nr:3'(2'),5'-bisphosphate nucleotidase CysQ [Acidimicrobiales bacterium]